MKTLRDYRTDSHSSETIALALVLGGLPVGILTILYLVLC